MRLLLQMDVGPSTHDQAIMNSCLELASSRAWLNQGYRPRLAQRSKRRADLLREELRLFPRGEVTALVELVVIDELGIGALGPAPRRLIEFVGKDAHGNREGHAFDGE